MLFHQETNIIDLQGEISEPGELTSQYVSSLGLTGGVTGGIRSTSVPSQFGPTRSSVGAGGGQVRAQRQSVIQGAHPVYSLMGSPGSSGRSKKIVLPPPGAY